MHGTCTIITALVKQSENNFKLPKKGRWKSDLDQ